MIAKMVITEQQHQRIDQYAEFCRIKMLIGTHFQLLSRLSWCAYAYCTIILKVMKMFRFMNRIRLSDDMKNSLAVAYRSIDMDQQQQQGSIEYSTVKDSTTEFIVESTGG